MPHFDLFLYCFFSSLFLGFRKGPHFRIHPRGIDMRMVLLIFIPTSMLAFLYPAITRVTAQLTRGISSFFCLRN